jgi:hemerythrin-like domain-containing protein
VDGNAIDVLAGEHRDIQALFSRVSSPDEDRGAVLQELMQTLNAHVAMEKDLLVPVLAERAHDGDLAGLIKEDHDRTEKILTLLERRKINSPDVPGLVTELLDMTNAHVATADSTVFPALRRALDSHELDELGVSMASEEAHRLTHPHPVLPDSGPLAAVTRKVAEVVDSVRDRSTDIGRASG